MVLSQSDGVWEREIPCEFWGTLKYQRRRVVQVISLFGRVAYERTMQAVDVKMGKPL